MRTASCKASTCGRDARPQTQSPLVHDGALSEEDSDNATTMAIFGNRGNCERLSKIEHALTQRRVVV
jgi:hypothetical protein